MSLKAPPPEGCDSGPTLPGSYPAEAEIRHPTVAFALGANFERLAV